MQPLSLLGNSQDQAAQARLKTFLIHPGFDLVQQVQLHVGIAGSAQRLGDAFDLAQPFAGPFLAQAVRKQRDRRAQAARGDAHAVDGLDVFSQAHAFNLLAQSSQVFEQDRSPVGTG